MCWKKKKREKQVSVCCAGDEQEEELAATGWSRRNVYISTDRNSLIGMKQRKGKNKRRN